MKQYWVAPVSQWLRSEAFFILLCLVIPLICVLVANPFVESAFNDDWSYSHVALILAKTGSIHYNGWGPAMQLFQAIWAAAWIRLFGFSFDLLRLITLPFSLGFVWLVYTIGRKVGLRRELACFGALVVGTSPLYIPLAATFMTEPYSCFFTALCLYAAICSAEAVSDKPAILWLWALAISGILGGSDRQSVWSAPLVLIPYLFWIRRSERHFRLHAILAFLVCAGLLAFLVSRFTQPYPGLDFSRQGATEVIVRNLMPGSGKMLGLLLACFQVIWPALLCFVPFWRNSNGSKLVGMIFVSSILVVISIWAGGGAAPFASSVLSGNGILPLGGDALGYRPVLLPPVLRIALATSIAFSAVFFFFGMSQNFRLARIPEAVLLISSCAYLLLLIPGAITGLTHDRYVLPLAPALVVFVLSRFQLRQRGVPAIAWACLIVLATYGTVVTHDYASASRARVEAAHSLEAHDVPRNRISAGFEFDGWTQLQIAGKISPIRYGDPMEWNNTNRFWFWNYGTALDPEYVAVSSRASDPPEDNLPRVAFTAWTIPFRRAVVVRRREDLPASKVCRNAQPCFP